MRFQVRDGEILKAIYANQGVLARRQLKSMFWADKSWRAMEVRLAKLHQEEYLAWPSSEQQKSYPIPEPVCWLDWRGAILVAGTSGIQNPAPKSTNENQLRELQKQLRKSGFHWVREPRWSLLKHDLLVIDIKLQIEAEISNLSGYSLERWINETEFRSSPDLVRYKAKDREGNLQIYSKRVLPDGYFEIVNVERTKLGVPDRVRFLLELDMSTHDNPSFGREKVAAGVAYIHSPAYKARFGNNRGRWLIVTNGGKTRMQNLMRQTREQAKVHSELFFFAYVQDVIDHSPLTSPIWGQVGEPDVISLLKKSSIEQEQQDVEPI